MGKRKKGEKLLNRLGRLSPFLGMEFIKHGKIGGIENGKSPPKRSFMFLRSFVPYYHDLVERDEKNKQLKPLTKALGKKNIFSGRCVGDAHPENFGPVYNQKKKKTHFTMNDADDGGEGLLYRDFLRYLIAVDLAESGNKQLRPILQAYRDGVNGKKAKPCGVAKKLCNKADKEKKVKTRQYKKQFKKNVTNDVGDLKIGSLELAPWEEKVIRRALKKFGKKTCKDTKSVRFKKGLTYVKVVGGSGGLRRYRCLVQFKKGKFPRRPNKKKWGVLEFKQLATPGQSPFKNYSAKQVKKIIEKNLEFAHGKNHSEFYYIKQLGNLPFELRPKWHCYKGVKLFNDGQKELSKKKRSKVYNNEAQILGTLHRSKAVHPKKYKKELAKTKQKEWIKAARYVGKKMKQDYQNLTKTLKQ